MNIRILFLGDIVGAAGQAILQKHINSIRKDHRIDAVIVNGENSADGRGITQRVMKFFAHHNVDMVTSGNHIWQKKEIYPYLSEQKNLLRPANFPGGCPGTGVGFFMCKDSPVGVINVQGRVFMREHLSCPFKAVESALTYIKTKTNVVLVDFHAETTSEKAALGFFLDGSVSAVLGSHTHVQTADERILPNGTAFITDLGMCGALNSVLGVKKEAIINHMLTQMPTRFEVETQGPLLLTGAIIDIDASSGVATAIERIRIVDDTIEVQPQSL